MASSPAIGAVATGARTARRDLRRFVVAGSALVVLGLVWAAALDARGLHGVPGIPLDESWMRTIHAIRTPPMVAAAQVFAWLGAAPGSIVVAAVIALALWWRRGIRVGLTFVVVTLLSEANVDAMKAVDLRQRPQGGLWGGIGSFPSGHTAFAAVVAATLGMLVHRAWVWIAGFAWVTAMAISRTVIDAHWLTDTVAGATCGAALAVRVWSLVRIVTVGSGRRSRLVDPD